jgi:hypothetical protein
MNKLLNKDLVSFHLLYYLRLHLVHPRFHLCNLVKKFVNFTKLLHDLNPALTNGCYYYGEKPNYILEGVFKIQE